MTKTLRSLCSSVALKSFLAFAILAVCSLGVRAQTPPPDDDDGFISTLIPVLQSRIFCSLSATKDADEVVKLSANCTNNPTSYEWRMNGQLVAVSAQKGSLVTVTSTPAPTVWHIPSASGAATYTVTAIRSGKASGSASASVTIGSLTPICSNFRFTYVSADTNAYRLNVDCTKAPNNYIWAYGPDPVSAFNAIPYVESANGSRWLQLDKVNERYMKAVGATESLQPTGNSTIPLIRPGTYRFWMKAQRGGVESVPIDVTGAVVLGTNPGSLSFLAPAPNAAVVIGSTVQIRVSLVAGTSPVTGVAIYRNGVLIGRTSVSTNGVYEIIWTNVPEGTSTLSAITEVSGGVSTSAMISVAGVSAAPTVQLIPPALLNYAVNSPVQLVASASTTAPGLNISSVAFFSGNTQIAGTVTANGGGQYTLVWTPPGAGIYSVTARATDTAGITSISQTMDITVGTSPTLAQSVDPDGDNTGTVADPTGSTIGATAGSFDVSEGGGAGYSIPIALPPGTAGMVPNVGLSYSSQGGGGLLGVGWSLGGLSAIHRCPKNYYTDNVKTKINYDANDPFCLDGQRLIEVSTGVYRTERDSYSRITKLTNGWKVESKSGLIMYYGTDETNTVIANARLIAQSEFGQPINGGAVKVWALAKTIDRQGNYFLMEYEKDAERAQRPLRMRYTGNAIAGISPYASVEFEYESNAPTEQAILYDSAGAVSQQTKRLKTIYTRNGVNVVRAYKLQYDVSAATKRSLLRSVTECGYGVNATDPNSSDSLCLPPTEFRIATAVNSDMSFVMQQSPTSYPDMSGQGNTRVMDLNGDGKSDFIRYKGNNQWGVRLGGTTDEKLWFSPGGSDTRVVFGDFNGDGLTDFVSEGGNQWTLCRSTGTGFNCTSLARNGEMNDFPDVPSDEKAQYSLSGDFDGDGRIDLAFYIGRNGSISQWRICLATGTGFRCPYTQTGPGGALESGRFDGPNEAGDHTGVRGKLVGDFNGDGRADIASYGRYGINYTNNWQVAFSNFTTNATGFTRGPEDTPAVYNWPAWTTVVDFNGDGLADMIAGENNQGADKIGKWHVCLSRGEGTFSCNYVDGRTDNNVYNVMGDFNGDGRTDIADYNNGVTFPGYPVGWRVCLSTGTGFDCQNWGNVLPNAGDTTNYDTSNMGGDFDGNGKTDIAIKSGSSWIVIGATGQTPDQLAKVVDGLGKEANFTYQPLTNTGMTGVYTKNANAVFPALDIQSPMYVVGTMKTNDGAGGDRTFSYTYKGLQGHSQGAGLLGFAERTVRDDLTGRTTRMTFSQDYVSRLAGTPLLVEVKSPTGAMISSKQTQWGMKTLAGLGGRTVYQMHQTQSIDSTFDPNVSTSSPYLTTTSTTSLANIDSNGNVTASSVSTSDGFSKSTSTTYFTDDTVNWLIGRPQLVTVQSAAPGTPAITRTSSFAYVGNTHLVDTETIEPDATNEVRLTTKYGYDTVGNRTTTTINGVGLVNNARTSSVSYDGDAFKRFATSATNALGHTASSTYDARFGAVTQTTDANGLISRSRYDRLGRKIASWSSLGVNQSITYAGGGGVENSSGSVKQTAVMSVTTTTSGAAPSTSYVDILGRAIRTDTQAFDGSAVSVVTRYDARGRKTFTSRPVPTASASTTTLGTSMSYAGEDDKLDRITSDTAPDGGTTTYGYAGFSSTVTRNPGGGAALQTTTRVVNSQGWNTSVTDAIGSTTSFAYDALGNLRTVIKPGGSTVTMSYDIRSRKLSLNDPDAGIISYAYNAAGEQVSESVQGGRTSSSVYDNLGRLSSRTETANGKTYTVTNTYDCANAKGKLCTESITQPSGSQTRAYTRDTLSRVTQSDVTTQNSLVNRSMTFTSQSRYDSLSRPRFYTYPVTGLTLRNDYDARGYMTSVNELRGNSTITHWQATARELDGQLKTMMVGGLTTTKSYDSVGRVTGITTGSLQSATYSWDQVGNLRSRADSAGNAVGGAQEFFCHDQLNRVTGSGTALNSCATSFTYTPLGNLTKPGITTGYQANTNKLLTVNGATVQYDAAGNITFDGKRTYTYNPYDIPDSISQSITGTNAGIYKSEWGFGPDKQRTFEHMSQAPLNSSNFMSVGLTWFAGAGHFEVDQEFSNNQWVTKEYRHFIGTPEGNVGVVVLAGSTFTDRYFLRDHLGSNSGTYVNGLLESRATYNIWGERISSSTTALSGFDSSQRGYTGHEHLATFGLIHMNGRIYDPLLGRFLQADPIIQEPFNLQSYNRYSYVMNNPMAYTDPTGYSRWTNFRDRYYIPYMKLSAAIAASWVLGPGGMYGAGGVFGAGGLGWATGSVASYASAAAAGFAAGGIQGGNLNSALNGAFTAMAFYGVGNLLDTHGLKGGDFLQPKHLAGIVGHAIVGCASAAAGGGSCGSGAAGSAFSMFMTPGLSTLDGRPAGLAAHALAGAAGSALAGGNPLDGALRGAQAYLFNQLVSPDEASGQGNTKPNPRPGNNLERGPNYAAGLLGNYLSGSGDIQLTQERFDDIVAVSKEGKIIGTLSVKVGTVAYTRATVSFYGTQYENAFGTAMIFYDQSGKAVGFYDRYNMNASTERTTSAESRTSAGRNVGAAVGAKPYDITYGVFVKPTK